MQSIRLCVSTALVVSSSRCSMDWSGPRRMSMSSSLRHAPPLRS